MIYKIRRHKLRHSPLALSYLLLISFKSTHQTHSVRRHERQEGGEVGKLETHERLLQETIETGVVAVTVAAERCWT